MQDEQVTAEIEQSAGCRPRTTGEASRVVKRGKNPKGTGVVSSASGTSAERAEGVSARNLTGAGTATSQVTGARPSMGVR